MNHIKAVLFWVADSRHKSEAEKFRKCDVCFNESIASFPKEESRERNEEGTSSDYFWKLPESLIKISPECLLIIIFFQSLDKINVSSYFFVSEFQN